MPGSDGQRLYERIARSIKERNASYARNFMAIAQKIQAAEERKRQLIDLYASGHLAEAANVDANVSLDQELHELKSTRSC